MRIAVASGKGGTGKTTIAVSLFMVAGPEAQIIDCDVEEPNAHIFIKPKIKETTTVLSPLPRVDSDLCNLCGKCQEVCEFNAILVAKDRVLIFPDVCHACGACTMLCPKGAISEEGRKVGRIEKADAFVHGILNVGEAMATPLIKAVKKEIHPEKLAIVDCPPGTSCPVIESMKGSDYSVLVTEPTPFGLNDLKLMVEVIRAMKVPFGVIINQCDIGDEKTIEYCKNEAIPILLEIPWDRAIAEGYSRGVPLIETRPEFEEGFAGVLDQIKKMHGGG